MDSLVAISRPRPTAIAPNGSQTKTSALGRESPGCAGIAFPEILGKAREEMCMDILAELETKLQKTDTLHAKDREELLKLLTDLKSEIITLSQTHEEDVQSIVGFTHVSMYEAIRQQKNQHLFSIAVNGLLESVEGFEASHPALVSTVNKISAMLSNMGI